MPRVCSLRFFAILFFISFLLAGVITAVEYPLWLGEKKAYLDASLAAVRAEEFSLTQRLSQAENDLVFLTSQFESFDHTPEQAVAFTRMLERFMAAQGIYDSLSYMDASGHVLAGAELREGRVYGTLGKHLDREGKEPFARASKLEKGAIYIGSIHLKETRTGGVVFPYQPFISLSAPVYQDGRLAGVFAICMRLSLGGSETLSSRSLLMVDKDGYWLMHPDPEKLWGFSIPERREKTIQQEWPQTWVQIRGGAGDVLHSKEGDFVYTTFTFDPTLGGEKDSAERWYAILLPLEGSKIRFTPLGRELWVYLALFALGLPLASVIDHKLAEVVSYQKKLRYLGLYDSLTGVFNRNAFDLKLDELRQEGDYPIGVIALDVDNLKEVNDEWGHAYGDLLLKQAVESLRRCVRLSDLVYRVGGDEFIILMHDVTPAVLKDVSRRIQTHQVSLDGDGTQVRFSIGTAIVRHPDQLSEALRHADLEMYRDKRNKKAPVPSQPGVPRGI